MPTTTPAPSQTETRETWACEECGKVFDVDEGYAPMFCGPCLRGTCGCADHDNCDRHPCDSCHEKAIAAAEYESDARSNR